MTKIRISHLIPIAMAALCLGVTPLFVNSPYNIHAEITSVVVIAFAIICLVFSIGSRGLVLGLIIISLAEMASYRLTIYKMADLFLVAFPGEFKDVRPTKYQPTRVGSSVSGYFQLKPMDIYGIGSSYLQEDFCPAPRQDLVSSGVKELFDLRRRDSAPVTDPRKALDPMTDEILGRVLGCNVPKLRLVGNVRYASDDKAASQMVMTQDIYSVPVITTNNAPGLGSESTKLPVDHEITARNFSANKLDLTVENKSADSLWLVYADAFNERWKATVDGIPKRIFPANIAFKAVQIEPGRHDVSFSFQRPATVFIIFFAMMVALALGMLGAVGWKIANDIGRWRNRNGASCG